MIKFIRQVFFCALFALTGSVFAGQLPNLGNASERVLTPQQEQRLGKYFFHAVKRQVTFVHDPIVNDYIQNLGYHLVAYSPDPSRSFHFFVVKDQTINAFAGPGGYVGINSGLILTTQTESELAAVMSHEIAHVVQGHIARFYAEQKRMQLPALGAALAAIAIGMVNPQAGMGAFAATTAGVYQHILNYSRGNEREADRVGMDILYRSGFDPRSMPRFFERMEKESRINGYNIPPLLSTHPVNEERLADAYNRSAQYPIKKIKENINYELVQARLDVDAHAHSPTLLKKFQSEITKSTRSHYAYSLALLKTHHAKQAQLQIKKLLKQYPNNLILKMTQIQIQNAAGQRQQALQKMQQLYHRNPDYYPVIIQTAKLLMKHRQYKQAVHVLRNCPAKQKLDATYLRTLFQALGRAKLMAEAYEVRARIYLLNGNRLAAIGQLNLSLAHAKNDTLKQQIKAKIEKLKKREKRRNRL